MSQEDELRPSYVKPEYKVVINEDCEIKLENMDGSSAMGSPDLAWIREQLRKQYEPKIYLYLIYGCTDKTDGLIKIGVSNDPDRRARELNGATWHSVECSPRIVWKIERAIHIMLDDRRRFGEWFDLSRDELDSFCTHLKTEANLLDWIKRSDGRLWSKIAKVNKRR